MVCHFAVVACGGAPALKGDGWNTKCGEADEFLERPKGSIVPPGLAVLVCAHPALRGRHGDRASCRATCGRPFGALRENPRANVKSKIGPKGLRPAAATSAA
jgi:hypothetical protein